MCLFIDLNSLICKVYYTQPAPYFKYPGGGGHKIIIFFGGGEINLFNYRMLYIILWCEKNTTVLLPETP